MVQFYMMNKLKENILMTILLLIVPIVTIIYLSLSGDDTTADGKIIEEVAETAIEAAIE